jgi:hypothetical protein
MVLSVGNLASIVGTRRRHQKGSSSFNFVVNQVGKLWYCNLGRQIH